MPVSVGDSYSYDRWIEYLQQNYCIDDDCDIYVQGNLAGCNIFCRNIAVSKIKRSYYYYYSLWKEHEKILYLFVATFCF